METLQQTSVDRPRGAYTCMLVMHHFQTQSRNKKPPDFIGRNRRAVRDDAGRDAGRGRGGTREKQSKGASDVVEISRSYLEGLLRMTLDPPQQLPATSGGTALPITAAPHIVPEPRQVPGLHQHSSLRQVQRPLDTQRALDTQRLLDTQGRHGRSEPPPLEEYHPWGRPGGGAPNRTTSTLTNHTTRAQELEGMRNTIPQQSTGVDKTPHRQPLHVDRGLGSTHQPHVDRSPGSTHQTVACRSQFARGLGPHVDTFVLSQREEQRKKELSHKEELAAQIEERQRRKETEKRQREQEEWEAEERARREIEEIDRRNERERERRQQKAAEERVWQTQLQARIQEAEAAAHREKQQVQIMRNSLEEAHQTVLPRRQQEYLPSRIPLATYQPAVARPPRPQPAPARERVSPPLPARVNPVYRAQSPVVPALAKKLGLPAHVLPHIPATHATDQHTPPPPAPTHRAPAITTPSLAPPPPPVCQQPLPSLTTLPTLPPSQQHTGITFPTQLPQSIARQQTILHQLAILREGIISQKRSLDTRIHHPMSSDINN